jgi:hypothetical protein
LKAFNHQLFQYPISKHCAPFFDLAVGEGREVLLCAATPALGIEATLAMHIMSFLSLF